MRALSLYQPWASLIVYGHKRIETRSWPTRYRGTLLIHASKTQVEMAQLDGWRPAQELDQRIFDLPYPFGAIIGSVTVLDCLKTDTAVTALALSAQEIVFGDYAPGRYA